MKNTGKPPKSRRAQPSRPDRPLRDDSRKGRHSARSEGRPEKRSAKTETRTSEVKPPRRDFKDKPGFRNKSERLEHVARPTREKRDFAPRDEKPREERVRPPREAKTREPRVSPRPSLGPRANIFGLHAVREAWLNPKRSIHALYLTEQSAAQFAAIMEQADRKGLGRPDAKIISKEDFDRLLPRDTVHQGAALSAAPLEESFIQDIISIGAGKPRSVILMLDQVTDPHNVGAILRSACAFGADGVVMQRRHAPELDGIVAKTASGAAEHIAVAYETNLSRTLEDLAQAGYTIIGLDEHAEKDLSDLDVPEKAVLILGAEGEGMRRLIREHCDVLVTLPTQAPIASLNVSNAAAVALYSLLK